MKTPRCPTCPKATHVIRHGFYTTKAGKRRRYRCSTCGKTFCSSRNTAYHRLQHRRRTFDEVAALSVEGVSKSAIARAKGIGWNTVNRWPERAAAYCRQFNDTTITGLEIPEIQAAEIRTFAGGKGRAVWIFASLDVSSRLWPSTVIGRRTRLSIVDAPVRLWPRSNSRWRKHRKFAPSARLVAPRRAVRHGQR